MNRRRAYGFLLLLSQFLLCFGIKYKVPDESSEKKNAHWYSLGKQDLEFALAKRLKDYSAKNVILFLGDGMGVTVTTAGRIFKGQKKGHSGEEGSLVWDKFPSIALAKTYNLDKQVPDSAATATAYLCGVKGNYYTIGVNGGVKKGECLASIDAQNRPHSILKWSQDAGKETGFVTSTRITHATPATLYAHSPDRDWECDQKMAAANVSTAACKDIARQLVEEFPGKDIKVIFGGGRRQFGALLPGDEEASSCLRNDSRNLVTEWLEAKHENGGSARYVTNTKQLREVDVDKTDFIMGLFGPSHMPYNFERKDGPDGTPTLKELTQVAIRRLQKSANGFFLLVEGGRIDHALHDTRPHPALEELLAFEDAVQAALDMTDEDDTLIIVTADHSHVMTINGYPDRGNDILGLSEYKDVTDGLPYTTLMFTTGNATNYTQDGDNVVRSNLTGVDTRDHHFMAQAAVPVKKGSETHGGEDVAIYATGPMSHLFHRVHEQHYVAHVMAYASCVGPYKDDCKMSKEEYDRVDDESSARSTTAYVALILGSIIFVLAL